MILIAFDVINIYLIIYLSQQQSKENITLVIVVT